MARPKVCVSVDVEVSLAEFDDRDLIQELESRGYVVATEDCIAIDAERSANTLFEALRYGGEQAGLEALREFLRNNTNRVVA